MSTPPPASVAAVLADPTTRTRVTDEAALWVLENVIDVQEWAKRELITPRVIRHAATTWHREHSNALWSLHSWMEDRGYPAITGELVEEVRARERRRRADSGEARLVTPDGVEISTFRDDAGVRYVFVDTPPGLGSLGVRVNDGPVFDGDPDKDGAIPVPQALLARLTDMEEGLAALGVSDGWGAPIVEILDIYRKAVTA